MAHRTWSIRAATIATMVCVPIAAAFAQTAIGLYTALLADGTLFYYLTMVPEKVR